MKKQEDNEPTLVAGASGTPKSQAFPNQRPDGENDDDRGNKTN